MEKKIYNVICVTKLNKQQHLYRYHLDITGTVSVYTRNTNRDATEKVVEFQGNEYPVEYVATGLDGGAILIAARIQDGNYTTWEFYTDSPAHSEVTPDELRKRAQVAINTRW